MEKIKCQHNSNPEKMTKFWIFTRIVSNCSSDAIEKCETTTMATAKAATINAKSNSLSASSRTFRRNVPTGASELSDSRVNNRRRARFAFLYLGQRETTNENEN